MSCPKQRARVIQALKGMQESGIKVVDSAEMAKTLDYSSTRAMGRLLSGITGLKWVGDRLYAFDGGEIA